MKHLFLLVCCLLAGTAAGPSLSLAAPAPGAAPPASRITVSLDFKQTPLHQALSTLFDQLGLQYSIANNVPGDLPITMKVKEMPFEEALRAMLQLANSNGFPVTYRKEGDLYVVGLRSPEAPSQPMASGFPPAGLTRQAVVIVKVPLNFLRPSDAVTYLVQQQVPPGIVSMQPVSRDNSLVVRGDPDAIQTLQEMLKFGDVPPRTLSVSVGISGPGVNGTPLAIRSSAHSLIGDDVTIDEQAMIGGQPAHLKVTLHRTQLLATRDLQVASDWDVSVPVAGGPRGPIRFVKRLSTTTLLRSGEQVPIGEVDLSGWGGKGILRLWIRGEWAKG